MQRTDCCARSPYLLLPPALVIPVPLQAPHSQSTSSMKDRNACCSYFRSSAGADNPRKVRQEPGTETVIV